MLGISRDTPEKQKRFKEKYDLPFPLLSDPDAKIHEAYGAWGEKVNYGKKSMGALRTTVLVGADGKVAKIFPKVKVEGHVAEVLESL